MSVKYKSFPQNEKSKIILKSNYENELSFIKAKHFKLIITNQALQKINNFNYFSKFVLEGENNKYIFNNISPKEIIQNIEEKSIKNDIKNLTSYDYNNIFEESNLKSKAGEMEEYNINREMIKLNIIYPDKFSSKKGKNILIKFDIKPNEIPFILEKSNINITFTCSIDINSNGQNNIYKNDIYFPLEIKKIVKNIQVRLEDLKQKGIKNLNDEIFIQTFRPNMGIIISQNPNNIKLNLETMKTNFNSIVKQKFRIKSILISFNLSLSLDKEIQKSDKSQINIINDSEKISDSVNDEITSCGSSNYNSPKISGSEKDSQDNNKNSCNFNKFNSYNSIENNNFSDDLNFMRNNFRKINSCNLNYMFNLPNNFTNVPFKPRQKKKSYYTRNYNNSKFNENITFLNSSDIFSKTLFNRYLDKSNSTCNFKILIEFLKIKLNQPISELSLSNFFNSFSKISLMSLKIPFFKTNGGTIQKTLTPSLKEIKLVIKDSKLIEKIRKKFSDKLSPINSLGEEILFDINGFDIFIIEKHSFVKIFYKEEKPYYLRESLNDKLEQLIDISKYIKKINIENNVIINKSYMNIEWNFINGNNIFSSSFISCYLFNSNLLGVLSDINEKEFNFWVNSIEERMDHVCNVDYSRIVYENNNNVSRYINSING